MRRRLFRPISTYSKSISKKWFCQNANNGNSFGRSNWASVDFYKVLGLETNCKGDDIKKAFVDLAKKYHPDVAPEQLDKFKQIQEAHDTLAKRRKEYDDFRQTAVRPDRKRQWQEAYHEANVQYYLKKNPPKEVTSSLKEE